jgi:ankyrin repeat protein
MSIIQWLTGLLVLAVNLPLTALSVRDLTQFRPNSHYGIILTEFSDSSLLFMMAANRGEVDSVIFYIENGVDVNTATDEGVTSLMYAASNGHLEIVRDSLLKMELRLI